MCNEISKEQLLWGLEQMILLRRFEEKCGQLYNSGLIGGFCHLYIGQEAVAVGAYMAKKEQDSVITSYRDHCHAILAGLEPKYVLAELCGKVTKNSCAKGGSMHIFYPEGKFFGGNGIVGAQVSIGTGLAFAEYYRETKNICYTFFGDGAVNQGQVFESFNMAALWKLPVLYIIENNEYAMGTSVKRSTLVNNLYLKGKSFGIEGKQVNGMNLLDTYSEIKKASEYVRSNGPFILEMKTFRYRGHSMSDPAKYRTKEEVDSYKNNNDPIENLKKTMLTQNYASEDDIKSLEKKIKILIQDAVNFVNNAPVPDINELYTNVYTRHTSKIGGVA